MKKAPRQIVEERFESREKLVDAILSLMGDADKDDRTAAKLKGTKNTQLLRIHAVLGEVQDRFGSKDALIEEIAKQKFAGKNAEDGYVEKLRGYTSRRLLDIHRQVS